MRGRNARRERTEQPCETVEKRKGEGGVGGKEDGKSMEAGYCVSRAAAASREGNLANAPLVRVMSQVSSVKRGVSAEVQIWNYGGKNRRAPVSACVRLISESKLY